MKSLIILRTSSAVAEYVHGLWQTDLFRKSDYVERWTRRFAESPAIFAEMSDAELEYPHFATWFGMTYLRSYPNPVISDLYYLHEIVHAALLTYEESPIFTAWYRKMNSIEFSASLETECYVYLDIPGLREISFKDEIWADRYLGAEKRLGDSLRDVIRQDRYKAMQHPDPMDYCEQQIAAYARQNFEWANTWKLETEAGIPAFRAVERRMRAVRARAISIDDHAAWLSSMGEIPFLTQARLFSQVYWNSKLSYRLKKHL